MNQGWMAV